MMFKHTRVSLIRFAAAALLAGALAGCTGAHVSDAYPNGNESTTGAGSNTSQGQCSNSSNCNSHYGGR